MFATASCSTSDALLNDSGLKTTLNLPLLYRLAESEQFQVALLASGACVSL